MVLRVLCQQGSSLWQLGSYAVTSPNPDCAFMVFSNSLMISFMISFMIHIYGIYPCTACRWQPCWSYTGEAPAKGFDVICTKFNGATLSRSATLSGSAVNNVVGSWNAHMVQNAHGPCALQCQTGASAQHNPCCLLLSNKRKYSVVRKSPSTLVPIPGISCGAYKSYHAYRAYTLS